MNPLNTLPSYIFKAHVSIILYLYSGYPFIEGVSLLFKAFPFHFIFLNVNILITFGRSANDQAHQRVISSRLLLLSPPLGPGSQTPLVFIFS
jgi:hypothetical protein